MTDTPTLEEAWPLASFIHDEMVARGWTTADVAARFIGPDDLHHNVLLMDLILAVQSDSMTLDDALFNNLSEAFGISASFFRHLHEVWLKAQAGRRVPFHADEQLMSGQFWSTPPALNTEKEE